VECKRCGQEVTFSWEWDYSVGSGPTVHDTRHETAFKGIWCDLPESQVEEEMDTPDVPEREYREDR
jgi:hypothetical protein